MLNQLYSFYKDNDYSLFGLIGNPVGHSQSPALHNKWLQDCRMNATYIPMPVVDSDALADIILTMPKMGFVGCNITMPFKNDVYNLMLDLEYKKLAQIHTTAHQVHAVNCLVFNPVSKMIEAYNTDYLAVSKIFADLSFQHKQNVLVIGAGDTARAICAGLLKINNNQNITILNRTYNKAKELEKFFNRLSLKACKSQEVNIHNYDLIINATSLGLKGNQYPELDYHNIKESAFCYDVIYNDTLHTPFLNQCIKKAGVSCQNVRNGYTMLHKQAVLSFKIWTNVNVD